MSVVSTPLPSPLPTRSAAEPTRNAGRGPRWCRRLGRSWPEASPPPSPRPPTPPRSRERRHTGTSPTRRCSSSRPTPRPPPGRSWGRPAGGSGRAARRRGHRVHDTDRARPRPRNARCFGSPWTTTPAFVRRCPSARAAPSRGSPRPSNPSVTSSGPGRARPGTRRPQRDRHRGARLVDRHRRTHPSAGGRVDAVVRAGTAQDRPRVRPSGAPDVNASDVNVRCRVVSSQVR